MWPAHGKVTRITAEAIISLLECVYDQEATQFVARTLNLICTHLAEHGTDVVLRTLVDLLRPSVCDKRKYVIAQSVLQTICHAYLFSIKRNTRNNVRYWSIILDA